MSTNYFQSSQEFPFHISVGAVLRNKQGEIACHYFDTFSHLGESAEDFYILMRETIEPNETIEKALARGLKEEFGAEAQI